MIGGNLQVKYNEYRRKVKNEVESEVIEQYNKWGLSHDLEHNDFEWIGLVVQYLASGKVVEAAALCESYEIVRRIKNG